MIADTPRCLRRAQMRLIVRRIVEVDSSRRVPARLDALPAQFAQMHASQAARAEGNCRISGETA